MHIWLLNKINFLIAVLSYPIKIIPRRRYIKEIEIDSIVGKENVGIVRRSNRDSTNTFDKFGSVREDALISSIKEVPGLSMNLLGDSFYPKHISFLASKKAGQYWDGLEKKLWQKYIRFASYKFKSTAIFFYLNDLHNKTFPYSRKDDKETQKLLKELGLSLEKKDNSFKLNGAAVIKHRPNKLNYWHIEFVLLDIEPRANYKQIEIKPNKIKSYDNLTLVEKISKQHWANQAAFYGLNDIILNSAQKEIEFKKCNKIDKDLFFK